MDIDEMKAGRELDALIAEKVMGSPHAELGEKCPRCGSETRLGLERAWCSNCTEWIYSPYPEYSIDIADAWKVLGRIQDNYKGEAQFNVINRSGYDGTRYLAGWKVWRNGEGWVLSDLLGYAEAETASLAICRAALKALQTK